jgi:hypothetical protein
VLGGVGVLGVAVAGEAAETTESERRRERKRSALRAPLLIKRIRVSASRAEGRRWARVVTRRRLPDFGGRGRGSGTMHSTVVAREKR